MTRATELPLSLGTRLEVREAAQTTSGQTTSGQTTVGQRRPAPWRPEARRVGSAAGPMGWHSRPVGVRVSNR